MLRALVFAMILLTAACEGHERGDTDREQQRPVVLPIIA
jgi:hypothetical protein